MSSDRKVILETKGLTKHYGGVEALNDADFKMYADEHIAIVGDNGAGKSTFVRNITGVEQRTSGDVVFDGESVNFRAPIEAREHGIETVYQNLALADFLDVPANIFLGREEVRFKLGPLSWLNKKAMCKRAEELLEETELKYLISPKMLPACLADNANVSLFHARLDGGQNYQSWMNPLQRWASKKQQELKKYQRIKGAWRSCDHNFTQLATSI